MDLPSIFYFVREKKALLEVWSQAEAMKTLVLAWTLQFGYNFSQHHCSLTLNYMFLIKYWEIIFEFSISFFQ